MENVINELNKENIKIEENHSMKLHTSYKVGGTVRVLAFPNCSDELLSIINKCKSNNIKYFVLGNCSNVILSDEFFDGVVIKLDKMAKCAVEDGFVAVEAGVNIMKLSSVLALQGVSGFEFASGIPGSIGGCIYMNAGAYNMSISDILIDCNVLNENGDIVTLTNEQLNFGYRHSYLKENKNLIVVSARFKTERKSKLEIMELINKRRNKRLETQPLDLPSAGSVFRNPENVPAGKLIEDCNLKGTTIGGAMVSVKHANFIVNFAGAKSTDIVSLIEHVRSEVYNKYNIELHLEQEIIDWE